MLRFYGRFRGRISSSHSAYDPLEGSGSEGRRGHSEYNSDAGREWSVGCDLSEWILRATSSEPHGSGYRFWKFETACNLLNHGVLFYTVNPRDFPAEN